jgi:hypothetical protein
MQDAAIAASIFPTLSTLDTVSVSLLSYIDVNKEQAEERVRGWNGQVLNLQTPLGLVRNR